MTTAEASFSTTDSRSVRLPDVVLQRAILDHVGVGITVQDATGRLVYANDLAAQIIGFPSAAALCADSANETLARFEVFRADGTPFPTEQLASRSALAGRATDEIMVRFRVRGETDERWSLVRATPVRDAAGNITHAVNFFREVTAQSREDEQRRFLLRATDALNSSLDYEQTLATVARLAVPVLADWCTVDLVDGERTKRLAVAHVDPEKIRFVQAIEKSYPLDPHAAAGVPNVLRTGRPELVPDIPRALLEAAAVDAEHLRLIEAVKLRSYVCAPLNVRGRTIGALSLVMAESGRRYGNNDLDFAQALADRAALAIDNARLLREAQHASEASEERFRLMVECVKDYAIFMLTPTGHVATWNRGAKDIKGYDASEIIGQHFSRFYLDEEVRAGKCDMELRIASQVGRFEDEGWRVKKDGSRFWANVVITRVLDAEGKLVGFTKVTRDLSERRKLEEERIARARAETALAEQKKIDELREQLLAVVGHDLRAPLTSISMAVGLMLKRGVLPDAEMKPAALIARNADRMAKMVAQLLDFTRARLGGGIPLDPKPMDLAELCVDMIAEAEAANPERTIVFAPAIDTVGSWDRERLGQVIANLLGNAIQHGDPQAPITLRLLSDGRFVRLVVHNHNAGAPIPLELQPTIFDPFRRAIGKSVGKDKSDSLGLGLYIVREIVHAHGGTIALESHDDGTTFVVTLPGTPPRA